MTNAVREIHFPKTHHFWMDAGLIGFYELAEQEHPEQWDVSIYLNDTGVTLKGAEDNLQALLEHVYKVLLDRYYNTSSEQQRADNAGFYYDTAQDTFVRFPKVKTRGIAAFIFDKAPRPTKDAVRYAGKGILPPEYADLQERFDAFLQENNLKVGEVKNLLIDGPNAHQPQVLVLQKKILSPKKKATSEGSCFICGHEAHALTDIGSTVFPLITGKDGILSFNSTCGNPTKVCWKCDYIGKFVPISGFYATSDGTCHMYFPYSPSLVKMHEVFRPLEAIKAPDPNYFRNFNQDLGGYFQKPYEMFLSFLYSVYRRALSSKDPAEQGDEDPGFNFTKFYQITTACAPLEYVVMYTEPLGKTQMAKMVWPFKRSVYIFRLLDRLERQGLQIREVMRELVDFEQDKNKYKTLMRNRVCERILNQQSIVDLVDQHVFHVNKSKMQYIKSLHDFTIAYEKILNQERRPMHQKLIDAAVSLGKTIGMSVAPSGKKGKGDLFRLRKARKVEDFLNEVNRIQIKYGALVTSDLYNKGEAFGENFAEFKQFCMIAALNTFNGKNREPENGGAPDQSNR
ncbi:MULTISPECIES: hypothetical protein [unclassified Methanoculleus]|jgi:hypothetical protein|uniref:Uncharacterized protein n=1 Tax=Methanoculleus palmolei TaxID=72612 RepID=A0ABD8A9K5_9EURY|nr:hypothetical protein R6Y95_00010 [Methanoculleus palmolei]